VKGCVRETNTLPEHAVSCFFFFFLLVALLRGVQLRGVGLRLLGLEQVVLLPPLLVLRGVARPPAARSLQTLRERRPSAVIGTTTSQRWS
jgi:hypothetical protein